MPTPEIDAASLVIAECETRVIRQEILITQLELAGMTNTLPQAYEVLKAWNDLLKVSHERWHAAREREALHQSWMNPDEA